MLPIPQEYLSSICEVKTLENELIATGIISEITDEHIEITAKSGPMDIVRYGTPLKVNVFNYKLGIRVLRGSAYISSIDFIKVVDVITVLDYERRNFFRVDVEFAAEAIIPVKVKDAEKQTDKEKMLTVPVKVNNLSLGGALITSDMELKKGQNLFLVFKLGKQKCRFECTVNRIEKNKSNGNYYGCKFFEAPDCETSALCAFIFQKQREQINRKPPQD